MSDLVFRNPMPCRATPMQAKPQLECSLANVGWPRDAKVAGFPTKSSSSKPCLVSYGMIHGITHHNKLSLPFATHMIEAAQSPKLGQIEVLKWSKAPPRAKGRLFTVTDGASTLPDPRRTCTLRFLPELSARRIVSSASFSPAISVPRAHARPLPLSDIRWGERFGALHWARSILSW